MAIKSLIRAVRINPIGVKWERFLVATDEFGHIIGCGQVKPHRNGSRELASIAVQRAWRKQGVAGAIIDALLFKYEPPIWLTCLDRLIPFYEKFNFTEITTLSNMPPYIRYVFQFFNLYLRLTGKNGRLAVMILK